MRPGEDERHRPRRKAPNINQGSADQFEHSSEAAARLELRPIGPRHRKLRGLVRAVLDE